MKVEFRSYERISDCVASKKCVPFALDRGHAADSELA